MWEIFLQHFVVIFSTAENGLDLALGRLVIEDFLKAIRVPFS
jgi:hypothetical protein